LTDLKLAQGFIARGEVLPHPLIRSASGVTSRFFPQNGERCRVRLFVISGIASGGEDQTLAAPFEL